MQGTGNPYLPVTCDVTQPPIAWLKLDACKKANIKLVTRDVSHDPIGELKLVLPRNTSVMSARPKEQVQHGHAGAKRERPRDQQNGAPVCFAFAQARDARAQPP